jgi:hypothetical protein
MRQKTINALAGGLIGLIALAPYGLGQSPVVSNGKRPSPPPGTAAKLVLEDFFSISSGDSPGLEFSDLNALAVRPDGSMFVLDTKESRVLAFDAKGTFLSAFGKKGQGPGEMNTPVGISISPKNEVIVEDALNQRLAYFDLKGTFLRHVSTAKALGLSGLQMDAQGRVVARSMAIAEGGKLMMEVKVYDRDLNPQRTLASLEFGNPLQGKINPFSAVSLLYALDGRGNLLFGTHQEGFRIKVINFEGKLLRTIERAADPVPVAKEDKDEMMKRLGTVNTGGVNLKDLIAWPDAYPPYGYFFAADDGRLLVQTFEKGKAKREFFWDVFDAEGRYIHRFASKADFRVWQGGKLYGIEEDEDGFKILKAYRTRWEK